jgi:hypothetical protein
MPRWPIFLRLPLAGCASESGLVRRASPLRAQPPPVPILPGAADEFGA